MVVAIRRPTTESYLPFGSPFVNGTQPPHRQFDLHRLVADRSVGQAPVATAVYTTRRELAVWTRDAAVTSSGDDVHHTALREHPLHQYRPEVRKQHRDEVITPHHGPRLRSVTMPEPR
ncbi:hypothetical protein FRAHR75_540033 [Frankia sp. Hr75.2]|nr:hypothetical protein FRAHR75_540033 [Frankia sp. Hr75.2]